MMRNQNKYRLIAVLMVFVFSMFNVGLPIVISACPMMMHAPSNLSCCANANDFSGEKLLAQKNTSCCKLTLAAERNTTEFVQSQNQIHLLPKLEIIVPVFVQTYKVEMCSVSLHCSAVDRASPPRHEDIPIFVSSLLI